MLKLCQCLLPWIPPALIWDSWSCTKCTGRTGCQLHWDAVRLYQAQASWGVQTQKPVPRAGQGRKADGTTQFWEHKEQHHAWSVGQIKQGTDRSGLWRRCTLCWGQSLSQLQQSQGPGWRALDKQLCTRGTALCWERATQPLRSDVTTMHHKEAVFFHSGNWNWVQIFLSDQLLSPNRAKPTDTRCHWHQSERPAIRDSSHFSSHETNRHSNRHISSLLLHQKLKIYAREVCFPQTARISLWQWQWMKCQ